MSLSTEYGTAAEGYEAVVVSPAAEVTAGLSSAIFLRRSARPSRRAVLFLQDLSEAFAPADLARWYNERGFHFYVADLDPDTTADGAGRRPSRKTAQARFAGLDAACAYLRRADGIDAIILSAHGSAGKTAALWCDARRGERPVDALILSSPELGRAPRGSMDIGCPVLVISADGGARTARRVPGAARLGQHVTSLHLDSDLTSGAPGSAGRRRLFDEMGRWLGAYMYGQPRDRLL